MPSDDWRIVFMGTPDFALESLRALDEAGERIAAVVTAPDKAKGRGRRASVPPVKQYALSRGFEVLQPVRLGEEPFRSRIRQLAPDLIAVAAYGKILGREILELPRIGCFNAHASLLPKYRGAAPIHHAILNGDDRTGVTIIRMDAGMDTGPILLARETAIGPDETAGELYGRLAVLGGQCLVEAVSGLRAGTITERPQDSSGASEAPMLRKQDGLLNWDQPAEALRNRIRGLNPWPGAFTTLEGMVLKIHAARTVDGQPGAEPGTVLALGEALVVAAGQGALEIRELQLEGRRRMQAREFLKGRPIPAGVILGTDHGD